MIANERRRTAYLALYDGLADWEAGHLLAELRTGRFTATPFAVVTVGITLDPITTMGGVQIVPDVTVSDVGPSPSDLLILPGGTSWEDAEAGATSAAFLQLAQDFVAAGVPVAAICGATFGLAAVGLLDQRAHTSADRAALASTGYAGTEQYVEARAIADDGIITAGPASPVQFARVTLEHLGLLSAEVAEAYEGVFHREDAAAYPVLMASTA